MKKAKIRSILRRLSSTNEYWIELIFEDTDNKLRSQILKIRNNNFAAYLNRLYHDEICICYLSYGKECIDIKKKVYNKRCVYIIECKMDDVLKESFYITEKDFIDLIDTIIED